MKAQSAKVERGKYLVENVALCGDCHTPRLADGQLDRSKWLKGAVLDFEPTHPVPGWHKAAPDLTPSGRMFQSKKAPRESRDGQWNERSLVNFLVTGMVPAGHRAGAPMPFYQFKRADAEAVVAYLKTLK